MVVSNRIIGIWDFRMCSIILNAFICSFIYGEFRPWIFFLCLSLPLIFFAAFGIFNAKTKYTIVIGSASGEVNALTSTDQDFISRVVSAMNNAIVRRG
jgi:hypothetical protein